MYIVARVRRTKESKRESWISLEKKNHLRGKEKRGRKKMDEHKQKGKK